MAFLSLIPSHVSITVKSLSMFATIVNRMLTANVARKYVIAAFAVRIRIIPNQSQSMAAGLLLV